MARHISYGDMKERVARKLQILADSESLGAEDGALIEQGLSSIQETLSTLGIYAVDMTDGVPEPFAEPIVLMVTAILADEFQVPEPKRSQLVAGGVIGAPGRSLAERQLRAMLESPTTKLAVQTDVTVV